MKCEACALAKLKGEWVEEQTESMAISSYIDAVVSGQEEEFLQKEIEKINNKENSYILLKSGKKTAKVIQADEVIAQMRQDEMFMKYIGGDHQQIMTGEISEVPVKIKIDSFHKDKCIVDLKAMANLDLIWNDKTRQKENFIDSYDYVLQGALYQEIVRQNTGKQLPFIIAVATKQKYSQRALLQIDQEKLDLKLQFLQSYLPHLQDLKQGKVESTSCNCCDYCISKQKCDRIWYYDDFWRKEE